jgi:hypothetical protein
MASSITIGDFERAQNKGAALDLLKSKTEQAMSGLEDRFGRWLVQGHAAVDGSSITTPRTSSVNGSTFVDPIPLFISHKYGSNGKTGEGTVGGINSATETWWKNVSLTGAASTTFSAILKEVDHLINLCSQSAGPGPDLFVTDLLGYEQIAAALRSLQRFTDYEEVDFPWKAIRLNGSPLVFDQFIPQVALAGTGASPSTTVLSGGYSTLYAANTKYLGMTVYSGADFTPGEFVRAPNGAGETSIIQWYGAHWVSRRDKQGVLAGMNNAAVS